MLLLLMFAVAPASYAQEASSSAEKTPSDASSNSPSCTPTGDVFPATDGTFGNGALGDRLRQATLTYTLDMTFSGRSMEMTGTRHIERGERDGTPVWRITDVSSWQGGSSTDTVEIDRSTLLPQRRIASGRGGIRLTFSENHVTGVVTQGRGGKQEIDVELPIPVYGGESALEAVVASLPLADGYDTQLRTFVPYTQSTRVMNVCVTGTTTVERPDGASAEALVVEMVPADGDGTEWSRLHVFAEAPHYVIEGEYHLPESAGSGTIRMTLDEASFASEGADTATSSR
ncbi:MAG: hypothetical protein GVY23_01990 [Spirochaetes bacterium]|jgi:hypothetical protein|nr:hypothetical protein [Spirochaetota bacterium]